MLLIAIFVAHYAHQFTREVSNRFKILKCNIYLKKHQFGLKSYLLTWKIIETQKTQHYIKSIFILETMPKLIHPCTRDKAGFRTTRSMYFNCQNSKFRLILIDIFGFKVPNDKQRTVIKAVFLIKTFYRRVVFIVSPAAIMGDARRKRRFYPLL